MTADVESLVLEHLRHIRGSQDRVETRLDELSSCVLRIETTAAQLHVILAEHSVRMDKMDTRLTRIEKRLDLVEV